MRGAVRGVALVAVVAGLWPAAAGAQAPGDLIKSLVGNTPAASSDPGVIGAFSTPFTEPTIDGNPTDAKCVTIPGAPAADPLYDGQTFDCKPAGVSVNVLPLLDGSQKVMYYDGLEGTENVRYSIVAEYGFNAANDQSRLLSLPDGPTGAGATWTDPSPVDGGANPDGYAQNEQVLPPALVVDAPNNDGALFCSDNIFLPDGRVMANGGTAYYLEPGVKIGSGAYGVSELEGLKNSRIYDPATNTWKQTGSMKYGRWYPSSITLPSGKIFVASGVTKLLKPVYSTHPADSLTNVEETETYDTATGRWTANPKSASRTLPLFPRLHELPDGKVFYNAAGQSFNPFGQAYDEPIWNEAAVYDPHSQRWTNLGIPGLTDLSNESKADAQSTFADLASNARQGGIPGGGSTVALPGFRGSTFSIELPLTPDSSGHYTKASFLTAGGVLNPPSPGSYFATSDSRITTVDTAGGKDVMHTRPTGDLPGPRWYPSGVLLPTGQVLAFNGSDRDEVDAPGVEIAKRQAELFDPATDTWSPLAFSHQERTYHNTAALLPDGRVLVGGHAPISTLYLNDTTIPGGVFAPHDGRDPSFEIFTPPYLEWGVPQPQITDGDAFKSLDYGQAMQVATDVDAADIASVVLVSNPTVTHLVDANQRNVVLPVLARDGDTVTVKAPPSANVAPPGPYMLFVNERTPKGLVPSHSAQTFLGLSTVR